MKSPHQSYKLIFIFLGIFLWSNINALELDKSSSTLSYISVKKNNIAEVGYFKEFSVSVSESGNFNLNIDLSSIDSGIEVRNFRLRTFLFEVIRFPTARVFGQLEPAFYKDLKPGQYVHQNLNGTISLHGIQKKISIAVKIIALADGVLNVTSSQPFLLNTQDFGLTKGVLKLAELAKLDAINTVVPISLNFNFTRNP